MSSSTHISLAKGRIDNPALEDFVTCPQCTGVLWKPVSCRNCMVSFCIICIKNWKVDHSDAESCPNVSCTKYEQRSCAPMTQQMLSKLNVTCSNASSGCPEKVLYNSLETHEEACGYRPITCSGCHQQIIKKDFRGHESRCPLFLLTCGQCGSIYRREYEEEHTQIVCHQSQLDKFQQRISQLEGLVNRLLQGTNPQPASLDETVD